MSTATAAINFNCYWKPLWEIQIENVDTTLFRISNASNTISNDILSYSNNNLNMVVAVKKPFGKWISAECIKVVMIMVVVQQKQLQQPQQLSLYSIQLKTLFRSKQNRKKPIRIYTSIEIVSWSMHSNTYSLSQSDRQ